MPKEPSEILTRCLSGDGKKLPRRKILDFAAVSSQPCCKQFTNALQKVKEQDLKKLSFEAMCVFAHVSPLEMLGAILMAAKSMKATESALKAILAQPDVVQTTVDSALVPGVAGHADRKMLHEAMGFLPTRKGGGIEINLGFGRPQEDRDEDSSADEDWDEAFPPLGEAVQEWSEEKHRMLEGK